MQAGDTISIWTCVVAPVRTRRQVYSRKAQTSAELLQLSNSNGTMLPMPTWVRLTSSHTAAGRSGGYVISAQMATCTAGRQLFTAEAEAMVALSAAGAKYASTTRWPPRRPRWQLSGTMKQMLVLLTMWRHTAISQLVGCVGFVAVHGVHHPTNGSANERLAAQGVMISEGPSRRSSTQPFQSVKTFTAKLSWQSGTMNAPQPTKTSLTRLACRAPRRSGGSAKSAQQARAQLVCNASSSNWPQQDRLSLLCWACCLQMQLPARAVPCHSCGVGLCQEPKPA